jgi:serine/threonine-protein kinase
VLTKAHSAGIVHRDLKPDNLWLWGDGPFFVKVLDFGVAKHVAEDSMLRTATGALVGTPHYMSPEQAEGAKSVDHRADIWALAVIALECVSGKRPFDGTSLAELLIKVARTAPPTVASVAPGYTRLQPWWERATAPAKSRYDSVRELAADFRSALASAEPLPEPHTQRIANDRTELAPVAAAVRSNITEAIERPAHSTTAPFTSSLGRGAEPQGLRTELEQAAVTFVSSSTGFPAWAAAALGGAVVLALAGTGYYLYGNQPADQKEALSATSSAASPSITLPPSITASFSAAAVLSSIPPVAPPLGASASGVAALGASAALKATASVAPAAPKAAKLAPAPAAVASPQRRNARPSNDVDKRLGF